MEGRPPVKGKVRQHPMPWTQSQVHGMPAVLKRLRQAGRRQRKDRLTALSHHIYNSAHLREAYDALKREAAPGVDGVTWQQYGQDLGRQSPGSGTTAGTGSVPGTCCAAGL